MECKVFTVRYGGMWDDNIYIGGEERTIYVPVNSVSMYSIKENINFIMMSRSLSFEYEICYLSMSRRGVNVRSSLSTDEELERLCELEFQPTLYVVHAPIQDVYRPAFDLNISATYDYESGYSEYPQSEQFENHSNEFGTSNWFSETTQFIGSGSTFPTQEHAEKQSTLFEVDEDDDVGDEDYAPDSDPGTESDEEADFFDLKCGSLADFVSWIETQGGVNKLLSMLNDSTRGPIRGEDECSDDPNDIENWLVPMIPLDAMAALVVSDLDKLPEGELGLHEIFYGKDILILAVGLWHMERRVEYAIARSASDRIYFTCKYPDQCPFSLRARFQGNYWYIHKFDPTHTCTDDGDNPNPRKVSCRVIATHFARRMKAEGKIFAPNAMIAFLRDDYGIKASYGTCLRARDRGLEIIYGGYTDSFKMLPGYLYMLAKSNPGSTVDLSVSNDGHFEHLFVALKASIDAWQSSVRPVMMIDGTHLKGKNFGVLFFAVAKDGNQGVVPLAWGIGRIENNISWVWFLEHVKNAFGRRAEMVIVSDAHVSIDYAIRIVYPSVPHGLCYYHMLKGMVQYGKPITKLFYKAAYAYRPSVYEKAMGSIQLAKPEAYQKLMNVGPEKWARCLCPVRRYGMLTSNGVESLNNAVKWARQLPICSCLEAIRLVVERWFDERREEATKGTDFLTPMARKKFNKVVEIARSYTAVPMSTSVFKVFDGKNNINVDLRRRTCACREFEMDLIPCSHAVAAILRNSENVHNYIDYFYRRTTYFETYSGRVNRVPPREEWLLPPSCASLNVLPPIKVPQAGRPRNTRIPSGVERATRRQRGHNNVEGSSGRRRAPKKCSLCRGVDHIVRECPYRAFD